MHKTQMAIVFVHHDQSWSKRNTMGTRKRTGFQLIYPVSSLKRVPNIRPPEQSLCKWSGFHKSYNQHSRHFVLYLI